MSLTLMTVLSYLRPDTGDRRAQVLVFFERFRTDPADTAPAAKSNADFSFLPVIAVAAAVMGLLLIVSVAATVGLHEGRVSIGVGCGILVVAAAFWWIAARRRTPRAAA